MSIKSRLRYFFVERNTYIYEEFSSYVNYSPGDHKKDIRAWWLLLKLTIKYRILRLKPKTSSESRKPAKLPYLEGSESLLSNKTLPLRFAADLLKYGTVSFDIFDTLLLRPFSKPTDLFFILEAKLGIPGFQQIRIKAEAEAREQAFMAKGTREVTIYDIYDIVERKSGLPRDVGAKAEFDTELEFCYPNPYMQIVYRVLLSKRKHIIATSDMYLPGNMIRQMLDKCGYDGIREVFVSCDNNCSKRNKGLYHLLINLFGNSGQIVHVGDNIETDIQSAKEVGLDVRHYQNVHDAGNRYRADGMSEITYGAYAGIINTTLHNGIDSFTPAWEYGFIYGGLYVLGFCNWLHQKAKQNRIEKILFLSRDGCIYQRVFNRMFDDTPNEYVLWSRIVNTRLNADVDRSDFIKRMVNHKTASIIPVTIHSQLNFLKLNEMEKYLSDYSLAGDMLISQDNEKMLEALFCDHYDIVASAWQDEAVKMRTIVGRSIGNAKRIAIVDVGWMGSGPLSIKNMIERKWSMDCEVFCYVAGSKDANHALPLTSLMQGDIESYMFSRAYNRNLYDTHTSTNKGTNSIFFELFTQAQHPSFQGIEQNGAYSFYVPEVENYDLIEDIHEGIYMFCDRYANVFGNYPFLLNITGYDAYLPFRMIIRDISLIKKWFADFSYSRNVGGNVNDQSIETISQILESVHL